MPVMETDRLLLSELSTEDAAFVLALLNSPGWLRYIGDKGIRTEEEAAEYILTGPMKSYQEFGFGLYKTSIKESNQAIGLCGLIKRESLEHVDIGFAFLPEFAKKGYAFEAASATLQFAVEQIKLTKVVAITLPENQNSIQLLEKIGLTLQGDTKLKGDDDVLLLYGIDF